jgi:tetratricopeptide (TPR) repeat protein
MIAMILDEALQLQYNFFQISIPFVTIGFYWYLKSKHKSINKIIKKEILRKYVEKNKYLSGYYKSSFFDKLKALKQNNSFDEIIKICNQYLKNNNPHPLVKAELWNEIGFSYKMIGENYKAIEMFVKVLEIDNEHLDASEGLAQTYLKLKDYDSTIEWLQKSKENFKRAINDSKILETQNNRVKQLTDELNKIEILLENLKSGYEPE